MLPAGALAVEEGVVGRCPEVRVVGGLQGRRRRGRCRCAVDEDDGVAGLRGRRTSADGSCLGDRAARAGRSCGDQFLFFLAWPPW